MSTTAETWFYREPENQAYLISERLNSTFWQARIVSIYWKVEKDEPPYRATGYQGEDRLEMEWQPREWLALRVPAGADVERLVETISKRVLAFPVTLSYVTHDGQRVFEWQRDGGERRWHELQGRYGYSQLRRLA